MAGYGAIDNGYARFDRVRIPREHMLSAFASVTPDGQYVQPPHAKLSYAGVSVSSRLVVESPLTYHGADDVYPLDVRFKLSARIQCSIC